MNTPDDATPQEQQQAAPPELPPTVTVAKLDANNIYWGVQTIDRSELTPEHVEVPASCDLTTGAYCWNAEHQRFDPLPRSQRITQPGDVSLEEAVHELVQLAALSGKLPPRLAQWEQQFGMSIGRIGGKGA